MAPYDPRDWHDFYVMAGGAAAALTGLLFVAMSLHSHAILRHPLYGGRAVSTLISLMTILFISGAVLIPGQSGRAIGIEVGVFALYHVISSYRQVRWMPRSDFASLSRRRRFLEISGASVWIVLFVASAVSLMVGAGGGFYILAAVMPFMFGWNGYVAWVLLTEVSD
jgi:modulator of FtsH protease